MKQALLDTVEKSGTQQDIDNAAKLHNLSQLSPGAQLYFDQDKAQENLESRQNDPTKELDDKIGEALKGGTSQIEGCHDCSENGPPMSHTASGQNPDFQLA